MGYVRGPDRGPSSIHVVIKLVSLKGGALLGGGGMESADVSNTSRQGLLGLEYRWALLDATLDLIHLTVGSLDLMVFNHDPSFYGSCSASSANKSSNSVSSLLVKFASLNAVSPRMKARK